MTIARSYLWGLALSAKENMLKAQINERVLASPGIGRLLQWDVAESTLNCKRYPMQWFPRQAMVLVENDEWKNRCLLRQRDKGIC